MVFEEVSIFFFWISFLIYAAAFVLFLYHFRSRQQTMIEVATKVLAAGWIIQTISLITRGLGAGRLPGVETYEVLSLIAWFVVLEAMVVEFWSKVRILGIFASPLAVVLLTMAWSQYKIAGPLEREVGNIWITAHIIVTFLAYGGFAVAAGAAVLYLIQEGEVRSRNPGSIFRRLPSLEVLDKVSFRAIALGFLFLTLSIISGTVWGLRVWKGQWDYAIVISSLVAWLVYALYLLTRVEAGWRGRRAAVLAILGFVIIAFIILVISPYYTGPHGFRG